MKTFRVCDKPGEVIHVDGLLMRDIITVSGTCRDCIFFNDNSCQGEKAYCINDKYNVGCSDGLIFKYPTRFRPYTEKELEQHIGNIVIAKKTNNKFKIVSDNTNYYLALYDIDDNIDDKSSQIITPETLFAEYNYEDGETCGVSIWDTYTNNICIYNVYVPQVSDIKFHCPYCGHYMTIEQTDDSHPVLRKSVIDVFNGKYQCPSCKIWISGKTFRFINFPWIKTNLNYDEQTMNPEDDE